MMRSISSMSATMPARVASSRARSSMPRRSRASGVRRSCETPASSTRAIALDLPQVREHRVESAIDRGDLRRARFRQRRRRLAAPDALDRVLELAQRTREIAREHERGGEQQRDDDERPAQRARRNRRPAAAAAAGSRPSSRRRPPPGARRAGCRRGATRTSVPSGPALRAAAPRGRAASGPPARRRCVGRSLSGTMRTPYSRPRRASVSRRSGPSAPSSAARSACNCTILVSLNWRAISAARSRLNSRIVVSDRRARRRRPAAASGARTASAAERHAAGSPAAAGVAVASLRGSAVGHVDVAEAPHRLDVARIARDRARPACAAATPARRSRGRTPRGRGRARAASAFRARAAGADAGRTP